MLDLVVLYPEMFPVRQRGLMAGYRSFPVYQYLYYSVISQEIRIAAILPGRMEQA
jgi:plasmid stabilization system protein ParE